MQVLAVSRALAFEGALQSYMKGKHAVMLEKIQTSGDLDGETEKNLAAAIEDFKSSAAY